MMQVPGTWAVLPSSTGLILSDLAGGGWVGGVTIYTTEDAYVAFVAGRISRDEFFQVCSVNAERDRRPVIDALEERERSSW